MVNNGSNSRGESEWKRTKAPSSRWHELPGVQKISFTQGQSRLAVKYRLGVFAIASFVEELIVDFCKEDGKTATPPGADIESDQGAISML